MPLVEITLVVYIVRGTLHPAGLYGTGWRRRVNEHLAVAAVGDCCHLRAKADLHRRRMRVFGNCGCYGLKTLLG